MNRALHMIPTLTAIAAAACAWRRCLRTIGSWTMAATLLACAATEAPHVDTTRTTLDACGCPAGAPCVQSAIVTPNAVILSAGETVQLVATLSCRSLQGSPVLWASSAPTVASVDSSGFVSAHIVGTAVIIATAAADRSLQGTAAITVLPLGLPSATINSVTQNGMPVALNDVSGGVDVGSTIDAHGVPALSRVQLVVAGGSDTLSLAGPALPAGKMFPYAIRWPTDSMSSGARMFPNGVYTVCLRLVFADSTSGTSVNRLTMTVNN